MKGQRAELLAAAVAVLMALAALAAVALKLGQGRAEGGTDLEVVSGPAAAAAEEPTASGQIAASPDRTWQTDGRVDAIVYAGNAVFLGGEFSSVRPPGRDAGIEIVARRNLAAFDALTGDLLDWNPDPDGPVRNLELSPDGATLYIGGEFRQVSGVPRRNLAAVDVASGAPVGFAPHLEARVRALAVSPDGSTLYVGGRFAEVNGQPRQYLAALRTSDAVLLEPWAPRIAHATESESAGVTALAVSEDGSSLFVGGTFTEVDGIPRASAARLDAMTGTVDPGWDAALAPRSPDLEAQVYDIAATSDGVYLCGDYDRAGGTPSPNLVRVDLATGARTSWEATTDGGVNECAASEDRLYLGGHFERVGGPNADPKSTPTPSGAPRQHLAAVDLATGALTPWDPGADSVEGVFAVALSTTAPARVAIGGTFERTGGFVRQQGFAQFSGDG